MADRLHELLKENEIIYGVICRDPTLIDMELLAQAGYKAVWIDLEHGPLSVTQAIRIGRTITHLGMIPLVRIVELTRSYVQRLLDGGIPIILLPDIRRAEQAEELVRLAKYPPQGRRGVSSDGAGTGFTLGDDPQGTLRKTDEATHLMVQVESDEGLANLEAILQVEGIDIITIGPGDWAIGLGLFGSEAKSALSPKVEKVLASAAAAGKISAMGVASPEQAQRYRELGVRLFFVGVDVTLKRNVFLETLASYQAVMGQ